MDSHRRLPVDWDGQSATRHSGEIRIVCADRPGVLANITKICEQAQVNINRAEARTIGDMRSICQLELSVRHVGELTKLIRNIEKIAGVESVQRMAG